MERLSAKLGRVGIALGVVCLLAVAVTSGAAAASDGDATAMDGNGTASDPYVVTDAEELQAMETDLEAHYVLGNDIDASETNTWEAGAGFTPVGDEDDWFGGSLDGQGHTIEGVHIDRPGTTHVGLFGYAFDSTLEDVHLEDVSVTGGEESGALVGFNGGTVDGVTVSGEVQGTGETLGGVTGFNSGDITQSAFVGTVNGTDDTVGGLAGSNAGPVDSSYAIVTADGQEGVGGLVGSNGGPIRASFATGSVTGESGVGGLIGYNGDAINDVYSTANVSGGETMGGLAGSNSGTITAAYTTGTVDGTEFNGGALSGNTGIVNDVYWNVETSGHDDAYVDDQGDESDIVGLETEDLTGDEALETTALDFGSEWETGDPYPRLQWEADRDVPEEAYDVTTEPVDLEDDEGEKEVDPDDETDDDAVPDEDDAFGVPGFGAVPAAVAVAAVVALIVSRKR